jgi:hypothetical protein
MCDEYDDERMWAFWRRLEIQEELKREESAAQPVELPLPVSLPETPEVRKTRPRGLTR